MDNNNMDNKMDNFSANSALFLGNRTVAQLPGAHVHYISQIPYGVSMGTWLNCLQWM